MKLQLLILIINFLIFCNPYPAYSFYPWGNVNNQIKYDNLEVYKSSYSVKVEGTLVNTTKYSYSLFLTIYFYDIFHSIINSGNIIEDIPPYGKINFSDYLDNNNYKETKGALSVSWKVISPSFQEKKNTDNEDKKVNKREKYQTSSSTTREGHSAIFIEGHGEQVSDKFKLPAGPNLVKVQHKGESNFIIDLLNSKGKHIETLSNEIGNYNGSLNVTIEHSGLFFLTVKADGDWSIEIDKPIKPKLNKIKNNSKKKKFSNSDSLFTNPMTIIILKNGRRIITSFYQDKGKEIQFMKYGGMISLDKATVDKIIEKK